MSPARLALTATNTLPVLAAIWLGMSGPRRRRRLTRRHVAQPADFGRSGCRWVARTLGVGNDRRRRPGRRPPATPPRPVGGPDRHVTALLQPSQLPRSRQALCGPAG